MKIDSSEDIARYKKLARRLCAENRKSSIATRLRRINYMRADLYVHLQGNPFGKVEFVVFAPKGDVWEMGVLIYYDGEPEDEYLYASFEGEVI